MSDRNAAAAFRLLGPRATATGASNPDSLQNVNTTELPDGSLCSVNDTASVYRLNKSATAFDPTAVVPASGPGQWVPIFGSALPPAIQQIFPLGTGADDWPRLQTFLEDHSALGPIEMMPGTWYCKTDVSAIPTGTLLIASAGVHIIASLPTTPSGPSNSVFRALPTPNGVTTTLSAPTVIGDTDLSVTSALGLAIGDFIQVGGGIMQTSLIYRIDNLVGTTVTVDRPILRAFPGGQPVISLGTDVPQNISLLGNCALVTGTANRVFELGAWNTHVENWRIEASLGDTACSFEVGSFQCTGALMRIKATCARGLFFESSESCSFRDCSVSGGAAIGVYLQAAINCVVDEATIDGCTNIGLAVGSDDGLSWTGPRDNRIVNVTVRRSADLQFTHTNYGDNNRFVNCTAEDLGVSNNGDFKQSANTVLGYLNNFRGEHTAPMLSGAGIMVNVGGTLFADGIVLKGITGPAGIDGIASVATGDVIYLDHFDIAVNGGAVTNSAVQAGNGILRAVHGTGRGGALDYVFSVSGNGALECDQTDSQGGLFAYVNAGTGSVRLYTATATGFVAAFSANIVNRGTFTLNGATPVPVSYPGIRAEDQVVIERIANGGTPNAVPVITITPGTGFAATGIALDTSTYAWRTI